MLDLYAVKRQIDRMVAEERSSRERFEERMDRALRECRRWSAAWEELAHKLGQSRTSWLLPEIRGPFDQSVPLPPLPSRISVAATDGSQIFPDRHEISSCFLINIGYVLLHYGAEGDPLMSSRPTLYYEEEDLYEEWGGRRVFVDRELVGFRRSLMEFTELAELALAAREEGYEVVALSDGTLIPWSLEGKPQDFRDAYLEEHLAALDRLWEAGIPLAGYISRPGGRELVNALKVGLCPLEAADCDQCPWKGEEPPCAHIDGVGDAALLGRLLEKGARSLSFGSTSRILERFGRHAVRFFYLHVGDEIGRVEVPAWVAEDPSLLDRVHACLFDQAEKGRGYPVCLAEAHEQAVVRGADREAFYRFLRDALVESGVRTRISTKSSSKRQVWV